MFSKAIREKQDYWNIPLDGQVFIESSAGTGKTYTLEKIYLRLLQEKGLKVEDILVVTFNESANQQLKERIQEQLNNPQTYEHLAQFTQAKIYTMHSFVNKLLKEYSSVFELREDFCLAGEKDIHPLAIKAIYQFFRSKEEVLKNDYFLLKGYDAFLNLVANQEDIVPSFNSLVETLASLLKRRDLLSSLQTFLEQPSQKELKLLWTKQETQDLSVSLQLWQESLRSLRELIEKEDHPFNKTSLRSLNPLLNLLAQSNFTCESLWSSLEGLSKTIGVKKGFEQEETYLGRLLSFSCDLCRHLNKGRQIPHTVDNHRIVDTAKKVKEFVPALLLEASLSSLGTLKTWLAWNFASFALQESQKELDKLKNQLNLYSFEDILHKLIDSQDYLEEKTLKEIKKGYRAILIDEFQDTDSLQWIIFSKIIRAENTYLFMIGDPKQAIYGFRGGDLSAFFRAKSSILNQNNSHFYHLPVSYRSQEPMVQMLNAIFKPLYRRHNSFSEQVSYHSLEVSPHSQEINETEKTALTIWRANKEQSYSQQLHRFLQKINELLLQKNIAPQDCAILSREKATLWEILEINTKKKIGLPLSMYEEKELKDSQEAKNTFALLQSLRDPNLYFSTLMLCEFFGLPLKAVSYLNQPPQAPLKDKLTSQLFLTWQTLDRESNFLIFMQAIENLSQKIRKQLGYSELDLSHEEKRELCQLGFEERLLLKGQRASLLLYQDVFLWLSEHIRKSSDVPLFFQNLKYLKSHNKKSTPSLDNRMALMTIHKAKGLEFLYVFIVAKSSLTTIYRKNRLYTSYYENEHKLFDFFKLKKHSTKVLLTAWQEEQNLLYVALTRAKKQVYFLWEYQKMNSAPLSSLFLQAVLFPSLDTQKPQEHIFNSIQEQDLVESLACYDRTIRYEELGEALKLYNYKEHETRTLTPPLKSVSRQDILTRSLMNHSFSSLLRISETQDPEPVQSSLINETNLPKGTHIGTWIHSLLEVLPFESVLNCQNTQEWLEKEIRTKNYCGTIYALFAEKLNEYVKNPFLSLKILTSGINMLWNLLISPLNATGVRLCDISNKKILKEHKFLMKDPINFLSNNLEKNELALFLERHLKNGYLVGVIDCIVEIQGKIYIFDWKTNFLGNKDTDYSPCNLHKAMKDNDYYLQATLYSFAMKVWYSLHRSSCHFKDIFGGTFYLFTRAFLEEKQCKNGIFFIPPYWENRDNLKQFFSIKN